MISVICVYNDKNVLNNYLLMSLENQTAEFQSILIDNRHGLFKSAAEALNFGAMKAKGNYLMFIHQDVELMDPNWLSCTEEMLDRLPNLGIAGVAGRKNGLSTITNIKHGSPPNLAGRLQFEDPLKVQTLDECLFIVPQNMFNKLKFDEEVCNDWHLYAVDYCLSAMELGYDVFLIPCYIYHRSNGESFSEKYYLTLENLIRKHKKNYKYIYTTMGNWCTSYPLSIQKTMLWRFARYFIYACKYILDEMI